MSKMLPRKKRKRQPRTESEGEAWLNFTLLLLVMPLTLCAVMQLPALLLERFLQL